MTSVPKGFQYLTEGGESKVYLDTEYKQVVKVNDAIYYASWSEYFNSLVIHNLLFPGSAYSVEGFMFNDTGDLCIVLRQTYVQGAQAELSDIKDLLTHNGFKNTRRQDYFNAEFRLLLEDMHDENVIARNEVLFFIDTVF